MESFAIFKRNWFIQLEIFKMHQSVILLFLFWSKRDNFEIKHQLYM